LLFEAKALDFAKIWRYLSRGHRVGGDPNDIFRRVIRCGIEGESSFAWENADLTLLRDKLPRKYIGYGAIEGNADSWVRLHGFKALGSIDRGVTPVGRGFDGLPTPTSLLADLKLEVRTPEP
jgi:hypothetical protein